MKYFHFFILNFFSTLRRKLLSNVLYILLSSIIFYILIKFDNYIFSKVFELQNLFIVPLEFMNNAINFLFETKTVFIIFLLTLIISYLLKYKNIENKILYILSLTILSVSFSFILKLIFSRERPYISYNPYNIFMWKSFSLKDYNNFFSLPSGHVITLICTYSLWNGNSLVKLFFIITLILVSFFRIYSLQHWPSDIFAAILFSIFMLFNNKHNIIEE